MKTLKSIAAFLDRELRIADFDDSSNNGVQVENAGRVTKVCCGVDASLAFFEEAQRRGADLVVCHHGISWDDSLKRITEMNYGRVAFLIHNDMALYACHLPLDAHPRHGNNIGICRALGLQHTRPFGTYRGKTIGCRGTLPRAMSLARFHKLVGGRVGALHRTMNFGPKTVRSVGAVSGGAGGDIDQAARAGLDVYVSGEPTLAAYNAAQELGMNAVFAGHYATEVFGVKALAALLRRKFRIEAEFIDMNVPY